MPLLNTRRKAQGLGYSYHTLTPRATKECLCIAYVNDESYETVITTRENAL